MDKQGLFGEVFQTHLVARRGDSATPCRTAFAGEGSRKTMMRSRAAASIGLLVFLLAGCVSAPTKPEHLPPARHGDDMIALRVTGSTGDYRSGDEIWCRTLDTSDVAQALNRDILVPRPAGRFLFGRLLAIDGGRLQILPPVDGARQQVVATPPWAAVTTRLIRTLGA